MSLKVLNDAVNRYHKILESDAYRDLAWTEALRQRMSEHHLLVGDRPVTPFLRPHFITKKQYSHLVKASESLMSAIDRTKQLALSHPALLNRIALRPAEKMLAQIDPGYSTLAVSQMLDTHIHNGHLHFDAYSAETPSGVAHGEALAEVFSDLAPMKEFRKKHKLAKLSGSKFLLQALLKAYKEFGGKKKPRIAILEFKQPFQTPETLEYHSLAELFRKQGYAAEVVAVEHLEYRNGVLRRGEFEIDLVYRRVRVMEFLVRFDLNHPLVRAYRERAVCMVNNFRGEVAQKKAIFDLLTDETVTAKFPAAERKAIAEYIPWTRVVANARTTYQGKSVDLPEFMIHNRQKLVLKPNEEVSEFPVVPGNRTDDARWAAAVKRALNVPYVVQESIEPVVAPFPIRGYAGLDYRDMNIEVHPHSFLGKVHGCTTWLTNPSGGGFSSAGGLVPTYILG
jgi:hypothetical protein